MNGWEPIETAPVEEWVLVYRPTAPQMTRYGNDCRLANLDYRWVNSLPDEQPSHWLRPLPPISKDGGA